MFIRFNTQLLTLQDKFCPQLHLLPCWCWNRTSPIHTSEPSVMILCLVRSLAHEHFLSSCHRPLGVGWLFQPNTNTFTKRWEIESSRHRLLSSMFGNMTVFFLKETPGVLYPETINTWICDCLHWVSVLRQFFHKYTVLNEEHIIRQKTIFCVTPKCVRKVNTAFYNTQADDGKEKCSSEKQKCQHISKDIKWHKIKCYQLLSLKKGFLKLRDKIKKRYKPYLKA